MRKITLAASMALALVLVVPASATAKPPTRAHVKQYVHAYAAARHHFGAKAVGCNLIGKRGSCHVKVTDAGVEKSLAVIARLYAPPPAPVAVVNSVPTASTGYQATPVSSYAPTTTTSAPAVSTSTAGGSYITCIISAESGGNPQAVNGQYSGIGQWSQSRWLSDGGGAYSSTPTGATYQQQYSVLAGEGTSGLHQQQGQYDRCG